MQDLHHTTKINYTMRNIAMKQIAEALLNGRSRSAREVCIPILPG